MSFKTRNRAFWVACKECKRHPSVAGRRAASFRLAATNVERQAVKFDRDACAAYKNAKLLTGEVSARCLETSDMLTSNAKSLHESAESFRQNARDEATFAMRLQQTIKAGR